MARISSIVSNTLIAFIHVYRYCFSALLGQCCRFEPSCSVYTIEAIKEYGAIKGCLIGLKRLLCCHPWHSGGVDLVKKADIQNAAHSLDDAPVPERHRGNNQIFYKQ